MKMYQLALLGILVFAALCGLGYKSTYGTLDHVDVFVTGKERVTMGSGDSLHSVYLVYTDGETFKNSDSLWMGKFNSSDLYGQIKSDHKYRLTVTGWRVPWLSWYRNIVRMQEMP